MVDLKDGYTAKYTDHRLFTTVELLLNGRVVATTTTASNSAKHAAELLKWRHKNGRPPSKKEYQTRKVPTVKTRPKVARREPVIKVRKKRRIVAP